jgi:hypothetical protein
MANTKRNGQLIAGVIVAGLGVLLLLERFVGFYIRDIWHLWPVILVALGLARLGGNDDAHQRRSGLTLVIIGLWLLVNTLELFDLDWGTSWPLLLIGLGIGKLVFPEKDGRSGGLLLLLIGIWALLNVLGLWGLYWDTSWPFAIIIVGLTIVWKALFDGPKADTAEEKTDVAS